ncbi:12147_t:CDS:2 [Ambispora leptoticha]|uniref:12147_t:CDS:1 n=1 Tax=Ambispora leptoticha TaxID=144679 RepID=A0A9N9CR10_9GLOM|nr:12147_t:CDS:2 [Ambispora leptoticha]
MVRGNLPAKRAWFTQKKQHQWFAWENTNTIRIHLQQESEAHDSYSNHEDSHNIEEDSHDIDESVNESYENEATYINSWED